MSERLYIHESIDVLGHNKARYVDYMCEYAPISREDRRLPLFGIWVVLGSSGPWPKAVNLWETADWAGLAGNFAYETAGPSLYDDKLIAWMAEAVKLRTGGFDRIMVSAPWSPVSEEVAADPAIVGAKVFLQETVTVRPGTARAYLAAVHDQLVPLARASGAVPVCALRTAMRDDDEVILIWAFREWADWGAWEQAYDTDPRVAEWRASSASKRQGRRTVLLCSGSRSPLKTGVPL